LILVALILGGVQIVMLGILGEYLWRNLSETRQRPRYLIEDKVGFEEHGPDRQKAASEGERS
jgi:dolichol-phosphate mannosyltransferase